MEIMFVIVFRAIAIVAVVVNVIFTLNIMAMVVEVMNVVVTIVGLPSGARSVRNHNRHIG